MDNNIPQWHILFMTLDEHMREKGLSDAALAAKVGVSQPVIWRIRNRKRRPKVEVAKRIEEVTGIPAADLVLAEIIA